MARRRNRDENEDLQTGRLYQSNMEELPDEIGAPPPVTDLGESIFNTPDGGLILQTQDPEIVGVSEPQGPEFGGFDENLADKLNEGQQTKLGSSLKEFVEIDLDSRRAWEERLIDGLEIIGFSDIPSDAVAFSGAAQVNYPGIAEAMIQFQSRAMEELMPAEGPVKCGVLGKTTEELESRASRVQDYMNYQLIEEDDEYYNDTDILLLSLPFAGSVFRKVGIDPITGRTRSRMVPAKDFIVPYSATSLKTCSRYTHRFSMGNDMYRRAVASGYFIDAKFPLTEPGAGLSRTIEDKSDDRTASSHPDDHDLTFCETTLDWEFEEFKDPYAEGKEYRVPYAVTFEWETGRVVRVVRVWDETDAMCQRDVWFTHYKLLPGLGFYGWGYLHIIGGLGRAASGALRLLLDGSATASLLGGFKSRDARLPGEINFEPAVWQDVDMSAEELAKSFYSPPFKEPSPALFKTLEILINGIQRFASTTEAMVGDASNTGPVGTTVALIEQGSKIFSGIHKRIHAAARFEFKLIAKCNYRFMQVETYPFNVEGGEQAVFRDDFGPEIDIVPVSDPNIFSSVQRIAIAQAGAQIVDQRPDLFPPEASRKAYRLLLKALRIPGADDWLPEQNTLRMDPVAENEAFLHGHSVQVFREQDDEAHLAVHTMFEQEVLGMDPEIQEKALPLIKAHKAAHFAQGYRKRLEQSLMAQTGGVPLPPFDPANPQDYEELPPDIEAAIARAAAQYAPPPPPPTGEQAAEDAMAGAEEDRKDMQAQREEERKDMQMMAELKRSGVISDVDVPPAAGPSALM